MKNDTKSASLKPYSVGSVSHATLRDDHLVTAFLLTLEDCVTMNGAYLAMPENFPLRDRLANLIGEAQDAFTDDGEDIRSDIDVGELINSLCYALDMFAPPYCSFGAHEGDFGFWPSMDAIDELPEVQETDENLSFADEARKLGEDCKHVNDHCNVTVYGADGSVLIELA